MLFIKDSAPALINKLIDFGEYWAVEMKMMESSSNQMNLLIPALSYYYEALIYYLSHQTVFESSQSQFKLTELIQYQYV